jgi:hypothetical protein
VRLSKTFAPPHALVFLAAPECKKLPDWKPSSLLVEATDECLMIACQSFIEGETEFVLGDAEEVGPLAILAWDGLLSVPSKRLWLHTSELETVLEADIPSNRTWVSVWVDHPTSPARVSIGIDARMSRQL